MLLASFDVQTDLPQFRPFGQGDGRCQTLMSVHPTTTHLFPHVQKRERTYVQPKGKGNPRLPLHNTQRSEPEPISLFGLSLLYGTGFRQKDFQQTLFVGTRKHERHRGLSPKSDTQNSMYQRCAFESGKIRDLSSSFDYRL